jgi:hypothetical protein
MINEKACIGPEWDYIHILVRWMMYVKWSGLGFVFSDRCPTGWLGVWGAIWAE